MPESCTLSGSVRRKSSSSERLSASAVSPIEPMAIKAGDASDATARGSAADKTDNEINTDAKTRISFFI